MTDVNLGTIDRHRYETFGGILSSVDPPFLAWVDRTFMRSLGLQDDPIWKSPDPGYLSAPTEVHFAVTNACTVGCEGCYMNSGTEAGDELTTEEVKKRLRLLRAMGVFHVALGGGEAFKRTDFREIVDYCRSIGLLANLTTNGIDLTDNDIETCILMGQVNVSMDGIGEAFSVNGRGGRFEDVDRTLRRMIAAGIQPGINCVVSRRNFHLLDQVIDYAASLDLKEIEFLKYKPSGRGKQNYESYRLTPGMITSFYPWIAGRSEQTIVELKIDCSFIPAMAYHAPSPQALEKMAVTGCDAGNILLGIKSDGSFTACSFVENPLKEDSIELDRLWDASPHLKQFRNWTKNAPQPCAECDYLEICKGGCRAVALYATGDFSQPDPECPFVREYHEKRNRKS